MTRLINPAGGAPSGAAGGELGGTYPNPSVNASHSGSTHVALGTGPSTQAFSDAAAGGSATDASKTDHKHAWPALGTTAAAVGTSAGGSATTPSKSDHVHATGAGTPSTQAFNDAAAVGTGPAAAMTDHKHAMPDGILRSTITANGDLLVGSGNDAVARLAIGAAGAAAMSNGTTVLYAKPVGFNASTAAVTGGFAVNTYMTGSSIALPASGVRAKATYHCTFDMVKTAFGTATPIITVVIGTNQSTADSVRYTFTFAAGTGAVDTAIFEVWIQFRSVGASTAAVLAGYATCDHHLAATGMTTTGAAGRGIILPGASAGFDSTTAGTFIGLCFNGGTAFVGTNTVVEAQAYDYNS